MDPMKILIAPVPANGHVNPMLAIARILMTDEHDVAVYTGSAFRARIEAAGAKFFSLPPEADFDLTDPFARVPELKVMPPGPDWRRVAMERLFVDNIPAQYEGLRGFVDSLSRRRGLATRNSPRSTGACGSRTSKRIIPPITYS
jgi:hypothetical protein